MIHTLPADFMFENSPVNHHTGQPALDHLTAALEAGMHAVTANKGPVVYGFTELTRLAAQKNRRFLFESAVMDARRSSPFSADRFRQWNCAGSRAFLIPAPTCCWR